MYDCLSYEDGTDSLWTVEKIKAVEEKCSTQAEIDKRVNGRFVMTTGRQYESYDAEKNRCEPLAGVPARWDIYAAVDPGSGGSAHPAAIVFVAVNPEKTYGRIFKAWRGDDGTRTTAGDVFEKYLEMSRNLTVVERRYDYAARDFGTIAERAGVSFQKAEKARELGANMINTLFKHRMLDLCHGDVELDKISAELTTVLTTKSEKIVDDLTDALRYCVTAIPWDWSKLNFIEIERKAAQKEKSLQVPLTDRELLIKQIEDRRRGHYAEEGTEPGLEDEFEYLNELAGV
jgi:hypothetical protein